MKDTTGRQYMNKKIVSGFAIAAAATLALGAVATAPANAATKTVKLAYMGPLTGGAAALGQDQIPGAIWAIDQYNRTNPKVKVELVKADAQCDGTVAANVAPGVAADKKIIGVIGTACSGEARNSFPAYKAAGLTMVAPSASAVDLTNRKAKSNGFPVFHRVVANDSFQGPALAKYVAKGVKSPKYYLVDDQSPYGAPLIKEAVTPVAKKLGTIVGTDSVAQKTSDWSSVVAKIKSSGANIVVFGGYDYDAAPFVKALRDGGYTGIFGGGDGINTSDFVRLAGGAKIAEGVRMSAASVPLDTLITKAELADFTKVTGVKVPGLYAETAWTATNVFIQCIKEGAVTRSAIQKCVNNSTFTAADGKKFKFDRYGDPTVAAAVAGWYVKDGNIVYDTTDF
jgi:branched-chain amino acid transport system substrate-binding protein